MVFHSDEKIVMYPKLLINGVEIERVDCFNFLGLQLNHKLKWNKHISHLAVLKFYSKLVNNNLHHYFSSFTPQSSAGQQNYNLRNPTMQSPRIKHEFSKQCLR